MDTLVCRKRDFQRLLDDAVETFVPRPPVEKSHCLRAPLTNSSASALILKAQSLAISAYIDLCKKNILSFKSASCRSNREFYVIGHPIQDPLGILTHTLFAIRLHFADYKDVEVPSPTSVMHSIATILPYSIRLDIGVLIACMHKLFTHNCVKNAYNTSQLVMAVLMTRSEYPYSQYDWNQICKEFQNREAELVIEMGMFGIFVDSPMTSCEDFLQEMKTTGFLNNDMLLCMRGSVFFLIGSCFLNPDTDVFEELIKTMSTRLIGKALAAVLVTSTLAVTKPSQIFKVDACTSVYYAAKTIVSNALADHANELRRRGSPYYRDETRPFNEHPCTKIVSKRALSVALEVYS